MPNPTNNKLVDSKTIAALFDMTPRRVQQLTKEGVIAAVKEGNANRYDLLPTIQRYIRYLTAKANGREPSKKDSEIEGRRLEAEADLKRSKADIAALQLSELEGTMHRSEDVEAVMTDLVYNIRSIRDNKRITCWLYTIGVDAGKATIMANLKVQEPGPKYCHFNRHPDAGYDLNFFNGLLSEKLVLTHTRRGDRWAWEKLPGHNRNEALDCRDYANAGLKIINPDMDAIERRLQGLEEKPKAPQQRRQRPRHNRADAFDDW